MKNAPARYGVVAKVLHWILFLLILNQFVVATMMLKMPQAPTTAGFTQGMLYDWHKSIDLIALAVALARYVWRKTTPLPWAPNLSAAEKRWIARIETTLYCCIFLRPISGYVFVMAGSYGVNFFGKWNLPNWLGKHPTVSVIAEWVHGVTAAILVLALFAHWGVGFRHHWKHARYLHRMLPFTQRK